MAQQDDSMSEFQNSLKTQAQQLVDCLEQGRFEEAVMMIHQLNQARDRGLYQEVGKLTRELHSAILRLELDSRGGAGEPSPIGDATDRLSYVVQMTEKAANRTMDLVETCVPLVNQLGDEARSLSADWQRFMRRELDAEAFRELVPRIERFLASSASDGAQLSHNLHEIMLAQDFQDLTGQVIKRVTGLIAELEGNLLNLVLMAGQVERFAGIRHDHAELRAEQLGQQAQRDEKAASRGEGPQLHADKREDVVAGQDDVDDLLSSLGF